MVHPVDGWRIRSGYCNDGNSLEDGGFDEEGTPSLDLCLTECMNLEGCMGVEVKSNPDDRTVDCYYR